MAGIKKHKNSKTNKMKNALTLLTLFVSLLFTSCEEDSIDLDADVRDEFIGNWLVVENSSILGLRSFEVDIVKDKVNGSQINISNFYKLGNSDSLYANISAVESNTITIPSQTVSNHSINGNGVLSGNEIEIEYVVLDGNDIDSVTAMFTRDID